MISKDFLKEGFIDDATDVHLDHEVQMAREECYHAAEHALAIHKLLRNISEQQGLEGWVSAKITLANDYLNSVREHLEYDLLDQNRFDDLSMDLPIAEDSDQSDDVAESKGRKIISKKLKDIETRKKGFAPDYDKLSKEKSTGDTSKKQQEVKESDPSGLFHAAEFYDKSFIVTAETAEGETKKYRVRAQSEPAARERFSRHHNQAKIISVKEESAVKKISPSKMSTKAIKAEMDQIESKDYDSTSQEDRDRHDKLAAEYRYRTPNVPSGMASGYDVDRAVQRGLARAAKAKKNQALSEWKKSQRIKKASALDETSSGSVAAVVNPTNKNKSKVGSLFGGTYKQKRKSK